MRELFFAASIEELWYAASADAGPVQRRRGGAVGDGRAGTCSSATTNDLRPSAEEHIVGIEKRVDGDPTIFQLGGVPWLSVGWNSAGLSLTGNELSPNDERLGISRSHQVLEMMRARSLDEMVAHVAACRTARRATTTCSRAADGGVANVEGSATDAEVTGLRR